MMVFKHSCVSTLLFNVCSKHGTYWFVFCSYIFCVCFLYYHFLIWLPCSFTKPWKDSLSALLIYSNWIDIEWLRHTKKYKHSEEWAVNSPHYRLFFWTISRFKARILTKKRDNSHKNKFYNKIKLFFPKQKVPDRPLQISETIWFTIFGIK